MDRSRIHRMIDSGSKLFDRLARPSSSNFKFAFLFLGTEQRLALERVYRFCRIVDDIVDERAPGAEGRAAAEIGLASWRANVADIYEGRARTHEGFVAELALSVERFDLPRFGFDEIIAGCAMDLDTTTYATMAELELYCYRVASCVGMLCIGIFGDQGPTAQRYARHLGLALQYTNILRDIGEDGARGRVYLPLDLLAEHGLTTREIFECRYDARFLAMAEAFAERAQAEYRAAWAELDTLEDRRALLPAEIMGRTYHRLLEEIRRRRYNVFTFRAKLARREKLAVAAISLAVTHIPAGLPGPLHSLRAAQKP